MPEGPRVLLLDDEELVVEGLRRVLGSEYRVDSALSATEGIHRIRQAMEESPPAKYAVIVSDLRMPGMDGVAFLGLVRKTTPDTTRILLTGDSDTAAAINAVNRGQVFRFLCKPCSRDDLRQAVRAGVDHHRLVTSERDLLERTLRGSVQALVDTLALANPVAFTRASRVRRLVSECLTELGVHDGWPVEVAVTLSQLGAVTLPPSTAAKLHDGHPLDDDETAMVGRLPAIADGLLRPIPRLGPVREIIRSLAESPVATATEPLGAGLLRAAFDYDAIEARCELEPEDIISALRQKDAGADPSILDALSKVVTTRESQGSATEIPSDRLRPGMVLSADLRTVNGAVLVGRGQEITPQIMDRVTNFAATVGVEATAWIAA